MITNYIVQTRCVIHGRSPDGARTVKVYGKRLRVDRVLSSFGYCTRSECLKFLEVHNVSSEGKEVMKPSLKVCPAHGQVLNCDVVVERHALLMQTTTALASP